MSILKQVGAVTLMNLKAVPQRLGSSSVIVTGIAGVVTVLVSILAMVNGLSHMMTGTVRADRAIMVSSGSNFESLSNLTLESVQTLLGSPGIRHSPDGKPLASAEALAIVRLPLKQGAEDANVTMRGVTDAGLAVHPEVRLVQGRLFATGVREVIVGRTLQRQFRGLELNHSITIGGTTWTIVGIFDSQGDSHESELWTNAETLQSAFAKNTFQSVTVMLASIDSLAALKAAAAGNPALSVDIMSEADYYRQQTQTFSQLLSVLAYVIGGIMAVGAVFGALNALYSAISTRAVEIATLRVLGFAAAAVVVSVFAEALLLAILGGMGGGCLAWLLFNGHAVSTTGGGLTQLSVPLTVDATLISIGLLWACMIGMVGAAFPAIRAARAPLATALRGA